MGILYRVTSPSGKSYVGITTQTLRRRWTLHVSDAESKSVRPRCTALCAAIRKYGADSFKVEALAIVENTVLRGLEMKAIVAFKTKAPNGYNLTDGGDGVFGYVRSDEQKEHLRRLNTGKKLSAETRRKIGNASRGKKRPEHSKVLTGQKRTPEQRARMSVAQHQWRNQQREQQEVGV